MEQLVSATKVYNYVIIDFLPELRRALKRDHCCKEALIIATPEIAAVRDADRVGLLEAQGIKRIHC